MRPFVEKAVIARELPVFAAVVRPPEDAPVGRAGLDQGVDDAASCCKRWPGRPCRPAVRAGRGR